MSIYKRGKIWWVDVLCGSGRRRVRKSTGCEDETQARIVEQAVVAANRGLATRAKAKAIIEAIMPEEGRGLPIRDARAHLDAQMAADGIRLSPLERSFRLAQVANFAAWARDNTRAATVADVTAEVAWGYSRHLGRLGITANTRNKRIAALAWAWKMLARRGKASENPWPGARAQRDPEAETHGRAFTDGEVGRILSAARTRGREWEGVVTVALYTGLRMRDVETLRWDEADMDGRVIRKTPGKTSRRGIAVAVPMHDRVLDVLREARAVGAADGGWVFPWRAAHPQRHSLAGGDCRFADILRDAGIVANGGERISFHCLRHTFVTRLAEAGVAQDVRMRLAGHTEASTSDLYTHDDAAARAAIAALK